ncbi:MAG: hypothetical protein V4662_04690 [Verrucomicrobiota bacterium]
MKLNASRSLLLAAAMLGASAGQVLAMADNFAAATEIQGSIYTSPDVSLLNYTAEAGEPGLQYGDQGAGKTAWWKWTATEDGFCTVDTLTVAVELSIRDTLVGVYTGTQVNALTLVVLNDDHWTNLNGASHRGGSATFYATKNTTYYIAADGYAADSVKATNHNLKLRLGLLPKRATRKAATWRMYNDPALFGTLTFNKTSTFSFTGKFTVGAKSYPLAGVLTPEGYFTTSLLRTAPAGSPPLTPLGLIIDAKDGGNFHVGTGNADWISESLLEVITFPVGSSSKVAGTYSGSYPLNNGVAAPGLVFASVKANGTVTGTGVAPDGVKVTFAGALTKEEANKSILPVCVTLHAGKGYLYHKLRFTELGQEDSMTSSNDVYYVRPPNAKSVFYTAGINANGPLTGGTVLKPATGQRALGFLDGTMGNGNLSLPMVAGEIANTVTEGLIFGTTNKFVFKTPAMRKPALTVNTLTGQVTGSIYEPSNKRRTITGALYKISNQVYLKGQVAGTTQNVSMQVMP